MLPNWYYQYISTDRTDGVEHLIQYTHILPAPAVKKGFFSKGKNAVEENVTQTAVKFPINWYPRYFSPVHKDGIPAALKTHLRTTGGIDWKIALLTTNPFVLHRVAPDGNCLFASIENQVFDNYMEPAGRISYCRKIAMIDILVNKDIPDSSLLPNNATATAVTKQSYITEHKGDKVWGGAPEIAALADMLQCPIQVWQMDTEGTGIIRAPGALHGSEFNNKQAINILYYFKKFPHYDSLRLRGIEYPLISVRAYDLPYKHADIDTLQNRTNGKTLEMVATEIKVFFESNMPANKNPTGSSASSSENPPFSSTSTLVPSAAATGNPPASSSTLLVGHSKSEANAAARAAAGVFPNTPPISTANDTDKPPAPFASSSTLPIGHSKSEANAAARAAAAPLNVPPPNTPPNPYINYDVVYATGKFFTRNDNVFTISNIYDWLEKRFLDERDKKTDGYSLEKVLEDAALNLVRCSYTINDTLFVKNDPTSIIDRFISILTDYDKDIMENKDKKYILLTLLSYNMLVAGAQLVNTYANSKTSGIKYISELLISKFYLKKDNLYDSITIKSAYRIFVGNPNSIISDTYVRTEWSMRLDFHATPMNGKATFTIVPVPRDIDFLDMATELSKSKTSADIKKIKKDLVLLFLENDTVIDKKSFAPFVATYKAKKLKNSKNSANATRKRSNSITKLAEKPLTFFKKTTFGFNTPDRARYRKLIPAVKLELEKLFEDNYNEVDSALNTQCMTDFFIHYIQELEKVGIAPGEPAAIAYYLTNGCNKSLLEVIDKSISLLLKELKVLINATNAPRPVNRPTSANAKYSIANKLIDRLIIFLNIYEKQTIDDGINKLLSAFLTELFPIKDSNKLPSLTFPMLKLITALRNIRGVKLSLSLKNATNRGKNSPICAIEAKIAPIVNTKYSQIWDHWLNRYIGYVDPKDADKRSSPLTLSHMAPPDKINILFFKIYLEYERLVQLVKTVSRNNSSFDACISPKDILVQIERANSIRKGKYEDLEHFIKQIFLKIYRQIFMIEYIKHGSPEISPDQVDTILSSIRVPPITEISNRFYAPRTGSGMNRNSKELNASSYTFSRLVSILHALENTPEIHPTKFELLSDAAFKGLLGRIPSFSVSELYGLIQSIESKTNYNTKSRGYIRIQTILQKAKEAKEAKEAMGQDFITPKPNAPFVPTPPNKSRSATPQPPPNKPRSASIGGFRYLTQKKQNKKHRRTRRSKGRKSAN